jgi:thiamine kinase-like enzyme
VRLIVQRNVGAVGELSDILERLVPALGPLSGTPAELDGGITNRNFRVTFGGCEYVVRRPGKDTQLLGIDRDAERLATEAAARLGIAPAVAAVIDDCLVTRFVACRPIGASELADHVEEIAHALRGFHDSATQLPTSFSVVELLEDYAAIVRARGGTLPGAYAEALEAATLIAEALPLTRPCPCHNDLLPGNIIHSDDDRRLMIVDWEYAGMGDGRFDLGNLSINNDFDRAADERLLSAYHREEPSDGQQAALRLMRVLSDAREAAWGVVQAHVSELAFDFEGYAREHFARLRTTVQSPQFSEWLMVARQ